MTINGSNDNSKFSVLVRDAMNAAKADGNRQRDMVLIMFDNDVTFSLDNLKSFFRLETTDVSDYVNDLLTDSSQSYAELAGTIEVLRAEHKDKNTSDNDKLKLALQIEENTKRLRAAQSLLKRCMTSLYFLRARKADDVKTSKQAGAISYAVILTDDKGKLDKFPTRIVSSGNALERKGKEALATDKIKVPTKAAAAGTGKTNPGITGVTQAADVLDRFLVLSKNKPITDYDDKERKALTSLFDRLIISTFADSKGKVHADDVIEYLITAKLIDAPKSEPKAA